MLAFNICCSDNASLGGLEKFRNMLMVNQSLYLGKRVSDEFHVLPQCFVFQTNYCPAAHIKKISA